MFATAQYVQLTRPLKNLNPEGRTNKGLVNALRNIMAGRKLQILGKVEQMERVQHAPAQI